MRSLHRVGWLAASLLGASGIVAACAGNEDDAPQVATEDAGTDEGGTIDLVDAADGAVTDAGIEADAPATDACSSAGWCSLEVDPRLSFDDLWPLEGGTVFAITSRDGRSSVVVREQATWTTIHDVPFVLTSVWASATDVWIAGGRPGFVAHGHRSADAWTWTDRSIAVQAPVTALWSTGRGEIYALADTRLWRRAGADDAGTWTVEVGGDEPAPETSLTAVTGTSDDDVWLTGSRGYFPECGFVMHKSGGVWETVVEGTPDPAQPWPPACVSLGTLPSLNGPAAIATATASRELVTFVDGFTNPLVARIRHRADGTVDVAVSDAPVELGSPAQRRSIWGASADDLYLAGFSAVRRGRNLWADGGSWNISTVAFEGIALVKPFKVVRGTQQNDVWLAGESYVFHKTVQ